MPVLLQLDSSSDPRSSVSRRLTAAFAEQWRRRGDDYTVTHRDLHAEPVPHLADASLHWPARLRGADAPELPEAEARQQSIIAELLAADAVVVGAPMYNYSLPSTLKTWLDHVHVPGLLAPFDGDTQPLRGRPVVVVSTRGAIPDQSSPAQGWEHVVAPLRLVLGDALGMAFEAVTVSRTLSRTVPALAAERPAFDTECQAAIERLTVLAESV